MAIPNKWNRGNAGIIKPKTVNNKKTEKFVKLLWTKKSCRKPL